MIQNFQATQTTRLQVSLHPSAAASLEEFDKALVPEASDHAWDYIILD
jgi:hypothetical protein